MAQKPRRFGWAGMLLLAAAGGILLLLPFSGRGDRPGPAAVPATAEGPDCGHVEGDLVRHFQGDPVGLEVPVSLREGRLIAPARVLLQVRPDSDAVRVARDEGLAVLRRLDALRAVVVEVAPGQRAEELAARLAARGDVLHAEPDQVALTAADSCCNHSPFYRRDGDFAQWNRAMEELAGWPRAARRAAEASRTVVAVLDTGLDLDHPDLAGACLRGIDLVNDDDDPTDDAGHGTYTAGLLAATRGNGLGIDGLAPGAAILSVKVADRTGRARFSDLAAGIVWAADQGAQVVLLPLGSTAPSPILHDAVRYAQEMGCLPIASTGNAKTNHALFPAAYPEVLAVGACDRLGRPGASTTLSPETELLAPGEAWIVPTRGGFYREASGTSLAATVVAAAAVRLWQVLPSATAEEIRAALHGGGADVEVLSRMRRAGTLGGRLYDFRRLDLAAAERLLRRPAARLEVRSLEVVPHSPLPGQAARLRVEVANRGTRRSVGDEVVFDISGDGTATSVKLPLDPIAPGQRRWFEAEFVPRTLGEFALSAHLGESRRDTAILVDGRRVEEMRVTDLRRVEDGSQGRCRWAVTVRNDGNEPAEGVRLAWFINHRHMATGEALPALHPGASQIVFADWEVPERRPRSSQAFSVQVLSAGESICTDTPSARRPAPHDGYDLFLLDPGRPFPMKVLYQQSTNVDLVFDAPFRIAPGRTYVPLMVYAAGLGSRSTLDGDARDIPSTTDAGTTGIGLDLTLLRFRLSTSASGPWTPLYQDTFAGAPTVFSAGMERRDEDLNVMPDLNFFSDVRLNIPGRYEFLRVPIADFAVAWPAAAATDVFVEMVANWDQWDLIGDPADPQSGTARKVLRITFASADLPTLPGEGHYLDVHTHSIAEYYFTEVQDGLGPRKAWGGPLPMFWESAYAVGMTSAVNDYFETMIVTDHNCFFDDDNRGPSFVPPVAIKSPDDPARRPVFGPTSVAQSGGLSEWDRMRQLFGVACGEELTFSSDTVPFVVPIGAHILDYRSEHIWGPWHGGSALSQFLDPDAGPPVELADVLDRLANQNQADNEYAFAYAAHPYSSGLGWTAEDLDMALGPWLNTGARVRTYTSAFSDDFILRGLQFFNGRSGHAMDSASIVFNDLNPWANGTWVAGNPDWDSGLQEGIYDWHQQIARRLDFAYADSLNDKFIRKIYLAGGSDAHGDCNFSAGRAATIIGSTWSYAVDEGAFGLVRTYTLNDGKAGASVGQRAIQAYADGNTVASDGPLLSFTLDAEGKFDSDTLQWHDQTSTYENADGRIGGGGPWQGERTMLIRRLNAELYFGYRWSSTAELGGDLAAIHVHKDTLFIPNPTYNRDFGGTSQPVLEAVGKLAVGSANTDLTEKANILEEGSVGSLTAFTLAGYTGTDPGPGVELGPDDRRCYTNPIWAVPVDILVSVSDPDTSDAELPSGSVVISFSFDTSMNPLAYAVEIKPLDANGVSADSATPGFACSISEAWTANLAGTNNAWVKYTLSQPATASAAYPGTGTASFVVYFRDPPQDRNGNALNSVAAKFTATMSSLTSSGSSSGGSSSGGSSSGGWGGWGGGGSPSGGSGGGAGLPFFGGGGGGGSGGGGCVVDPDVGGGVLLLLLVLLGLTTWGVRSVRPRSEGPA